MLRRQARSGHSTHDGKALKLSALLPKFFTHSLIKSVELLSGEALKLR